MPILGMIFILSSRTFAKVESAPTKSTLPLVCRGCLIVRPHWWRSARESIYGISHYVPPSENFSFLQHSRLMQWKHYEQLLRRWCSSEQGSTCKCSLVDDQLCKYRASTDKSKYDTGYWYLHDFQRKFAQFVYSMGTISTVLLLSYFSFSHHNSGTWFVAMTWEALNFAWFLR